MTPKRELPSDTRLRRARFSVPMVDESYKRRHNSHIFLPSHGKDHHMRTICWVGLAVIVVISPVLGQNASTGASEGLPALSHFDLNVVNRDIDPCVDFYKFAGSKWLAANPIPADQA